MYEYLNLSKSFAKTSSFNTRTWFNKSILNVNVGAKYPFDNKKWHLKKSRYSMKMNNQDILHKSHNYNLYRLISGTRQ